MGGERGPCCDPHRADADIKRPVNKHLSRPARGELTPPRSFHLSSPLLGSTCQAAANSHVTTEIKKIHEDQDTTA